MEVDDAPGGEKDTAVPSGVPVPSPPLGTVAPAQQVLSREQRRIQVQTLWAFTPMTAAAIAEATGENDRSVRHWIARYRAGLGYHDQPRTGRPKKITPKVGKRLVALTRGKRRRSTRCVAGLMRREGVTVSHEAVRYTWRGLGLIPHRQVKRPRLTKQQKKHRVTFATRYLHHNWRYTLLTDEKTFSGGSVPNRQNDVIWDYPGTEFVAEIVRHGPSVTVWGALSWFGLVPVQEYEYPLNSGKYMQVIRQARADIMRLFQGHPFYFQQDGASPHTSRLTMKFLHQRFNHIIPPQDWPPNSPDLNPIENLWGNIQYKLDEFDCPSARQIRTIIEEVWTSTKLEECKNLVDSMPARLQQCLDRKGGWTDY